MGSEEPSSKATFPTLPYTFYPAVIQQTTSVPRWRRHGSGTQASGQLSFEDNVSLDQKKPNDKRQREEQGQGLMRLRGYCLTAAQVLCHGEWRGEEVLRLRTHVLCRTCAIQ